ncbi:MAG: glycosyltransferase [Bacilli bacterium]|jgi:glycosyltransferase involved in cell wall biosynthesis|nr:glycosyltransferase [Bacilli bacterium]
MKIIYLTTAVEGKAYESFAKNAPFLPNPSNQNFHLRLIEVLSLHNEVEVISLPPVRSSYALKDEGKFHYLPYSHGLVSAFFAKPRQIRKIGMELFTGSTPIIVFDPLNIALAKGSENLAKARGAKRLAILTDNPENISKSRQIYAKLVFRHTKRADGSIALLKSLVIAYGLIKKPYAQIFGIAVKSESEPIKPNRPYIYFGGALYERYGIGDLLHAYIKSKLDYDLLLAGHGPMKEAILEAAKANERIRFLGQLSAEENAAYEKGAALLINPRRNERKLDLESIPSKMFEYLVSGRPIVSTPSPYFLDEYPNDVNWLPNSGEKALEMFLLDHLDPNGKLIDILPNHASEKAIKEFGLDATEGKIQRLIAALNSSIN